MAKSKLEWDTLITNALIFDGSGNRPVLADLAIKDGKIAAYGDNLKAENAKEVFDGVGKWLMPGLLDIHSHYDLEVEGAPHLPESVRHGTTTVINSNCSLGVAFGKQMSKERPEENPILDCFARVENIPKKVLSKLIDGAITWDNTGDYIDHFDELPLGPNVAVMVPHTMLRIEVMGLEDHLIVIKDAIEDNIYGVWTVTDEADQEYEIHITDIVFEDAEEKAKITAKLHNA